MTVSSFSVFPRMREDAMSRRKRPRRFTEIPIANVRWSQPIAADLNPTTCPVIRELLPVRLRGRRYDIQTLHDDWCACFKGGICNCEPVCNLIELSPPEFN